MTASTLRPFDKLTAQGEGVTHRCPCCGGPVVGGAVPREELAGRIDIESDLFRRIVRRLAWRPGLWVSTHDIVDHLWGGTEDGGPLTAAHVVRRTISLYRPRLAPMGWIIEGQIGRGSSGYRLVLL